MSEQESIKDTLNVIRKALEDESVNNSNELNENILILNKLIEDDGTINVIDNNKLNKSETLKILNNKLDDVFDKYFTKWLDKNVPNYIEQYFKNKKI